MKGLMAGLVVVMLSLAIWFSTVCFSYSLHIIFGKDLPWYVDVIGGMILNGVIVSIAFICWIISLCGVATPLV